MNKQEIIDKINKVVITVIASVGIFALIGLFYFIIKEALPALLNDGAGIFTSFDWYPTDYNNPEFGILAMLIGSVLITFLASIIVIPIGYMVAFFMFDYANKYEKNILKSTIDLLSGVPSVIIGSFLLFHVSPLFLKLGAWSGENILIGAFGLGILSLPYTASLMQEAMNAVDKNLKEGALALGSTRFTAGFKVVSKAALPGILNAGILTINRIIGETMVVLMVAGGAALIPRSFFDPVRPLTAAIAGEMGEVEMGSMHYHALFLAGLTLLLISFVLTLISKKMSRRWSH